MARLLLVAATLIATSICYLCPIAALAEPSTAAVKLHPLREAYYGDLHLHTTYSYDAYAAFGAQMDLDGAYRFARGGPGKFLDEEVQRSTLPLDFLAVTDHSELMGVFNEAKAPAEARRKLSAWFSQLTSRVRPLPDASAVLGMDTKAIMQSAWQRQIEAANRHYEPGKFTTFIAYEWSASPELQNLHRNVLFRGNSAPNPFTAIDSARPEDLWSFLESVRKQGHEALAIPHNANASNGAMFDWADSDGKPIDQAYAARRAANEPLVEISQNKGTSETHPALSPNDEFANFEIYDFVQKRRKDNSTSPAGSYVRDGLGRGMQIAAGAGGVNPFKYGFVGASDFHNGLSESAEKAYAGLLVAVDPKKLPDLDQWMDRTVENSPGARELYTADLYYSGSANLTGVWAEQNTRESLFAALRRKETFATSGTRLKLRLFGGWDYSSKLLKSREWVKAAYRDGVAMGGDLPARPGGSQAPVFAVWAMKDPNGANLDRLQVIKVWLESGKHHEKVYDVALSDGRKVNPRTGKAPAVGNTVDVTKATYVNTVGGTELGTLWVDPDFDSNVPAVYYLRVLEIPTPRWSTIVSVKRGQALPDEVPASIQERGWSSPIWYLPRSTRNSRD